MTSNQSFRSLNKKVSTIALMYVFARKKSYLEKTINNKYSDFVNKVNNCFDRLNGIDKLFINNEFFYEEYPYWWIDIYSKSSFYRYKRKAMMSFLREYENA